MDATGQTPEIKMDGNSMCREEVFTDNQIGTIRKLTPVTASGEDDGARAIQYFGSTQIMTPAGALPLNFEILADSFASAIEGFGKAAQDAVERTMEELQELQRQATSQIVVPKAGMGPGAMGGGGIQMP